MKALAALITLLLFGSGAWFLVGLLFDGRKRVHRFVCRLHRSPYPPHPEDWVITHHIRLVLVLIGLVLFSSVVGVIGSLAGLALAVLQ